MPKLKVGRRRGACSISGELTERLAKLGIFLSQKQAEPDEGDEAEWPLLPSQFSHIGNGIDYEDRPVEQQIAYRLLMRNILDLTTDNEAVKFRTIREIRDWIANDAAKGDPPSEEGFEYPFAYWCEQLGVDDEYMARKLEEFMRKVESESKNLR